MRVTQGSTDADTFKYEAPSFIRRTARGGKGLLVYCRERDKEEFEEARWKSKIRTWRICVQKQQHSWAGIMKSKQHWTYKHSENDKATAIL